MNVDLNKDLKDTLQKKTIKNTLNYFEVKNFKLFERLKHFSFRCKQNVNLYLS